MRLIDAEPLEQLGDDKRGYGYVPIEDLCTAPTIEAIPVEWLEDKINMYDYLANHSEGIWAEIYDEWAHLLTQMIEKWRKDNEG